MADIGNIGNVLAGVGAGLSGRGIEFQRNQMAEKEQRRLSAAEERAQLSERRKAIFTDSLGALNLARQGRFDLVVQLGENRLQSAAQIPGIDPSGTQQLTQLAQMAAEGNTEARDRLIASLENNVKLGRAIGPDAGGLAAATPSQFGAGQQTLKDTEGSLFTSISIRDPATGTARSIVVPVGGGDAQPVGELQVVGSSGQTPAELIEQARAVSAAKAEGTGTGAGATQRVQLAIDEGVGAAQGVALLNRTIDLLDNVKTGGISAALLNAKQFFGVESANEAELSANLGKSVLAQLKTIFGSQFTEKEGDRLAAIEAKIGKSTAGNRRLLQQTLNIATKAAQRGIRAAKRAGDNDAVADIQALLAQTLSDVDLSGQFGAGDQAEGQADAGQIAEGTTATNPATGEKVVFTNGTWQPAS